MHPVSGDPNAAPRTSGLKISFRFVPISSMSKSTMNYSLNLLTLLWRTRSGPTLHGRFQDLIRSSFGSTVASIVVEGPATIVKFFCIASEKKSKGHNGLACWLPLSLLTTNCLKKQLCFE